jgi:hypothetical protein
MVGRHRAMRVLGNVFGCALGGLFAVAVGGSTASSHAASPDAAAQRHAARVAARAQAGDPHGDTDPFEAAPIFEVLRKRGRKASGDFHLELDNMRREEMRAIYAWQLTSDTGDLLAEGTAPGIGKIPASSFYVGESWSLPELEDGYYRVSFTVASAGKSANTDTVQLQDWWLQVENGDIQELSSSEWLERAPGASAARQVTP